MRHWFVLLFALLSFSNFNLALAGTVPDCMDGDRVLPVNNDQVLDWKHSTQNQFRDRGHVHGNIVQVYPDKNGHDHFSIQIGKQSDDLIEVIYNQDFGTTPALHEGMEVEACGDYITSIAQSGPYPPSPVGAIVHWVHLNPKHSGHESGFLAIDGQVYGQDAENAGPKKSPPPFPRHRRHKH
jgi:hypothetical protein